MSWKNLYKLDDSLAFGDGYKIEFYDDMGNVIKWIQVRYAGPSNKKFNAFRNAFMKPHERKIAQGNMHEAESDKLLQECFVRGGIVVAWSDDTPITIESFRESMEEAPPEVWRDIYSTTYNPKFYALVSKEAETGN